MGDTNRGLSEFEISQLREVYTSYIMLYDTMYRGEPICTAATGLPEECSRLGSSEYDNMQIRNAYRCREVFLALDSQSGSATDALRAARMFLNATKQDRSQDDDTSHSVQLHRNFMVSILAGAHYHLDRQSRLRIDADTTLEAEAQAIEAAILRVRDEYNIDEQNASTAGLPDADEGGILGRVDNMLSVLERTMSDTKAELEKMKGESKPSEASFTETFDIL